MPYTSPMKYTISTPPYTEVHCIIDALLNAAMNLPGCYISPRRPLCQTTYSSHKNQPTTTDKLHGRTYTISPSHPPEFLRNYYINLNQKFSTRRDMTPYGAINNFHIFFIFKFHVTAVFSYGNLKRRKTYYMKVL